MLSLALDRERFDRIFHVTVQVQFDCADLCELQMNANNAFFAFRAFPCFQLPASPIRITEAVIAVTPLKARVVGLFAMLHTPEEVVIGSLEAQDHILKDLCLKSFDDSPSETAAGLRVLTRDKLAIALDMI